MPPIEVAWEWLDRPGLECARVVEVGQSIEVAGVVVTTLDGKAIRLNYAVVCDAAWRFQRARVEAFSDGNRTPRLVERTPEGWNVDGLSRPDLKECVDIDIMGTPVTNTLAIRRLPWRPGDSRDLTMAYIHVPDLEVAAVSQRYSRVEDAATGVERFQYQLVGRRIAGAGAQVQRFKYHSVETGFTAELHIDDAGLVLTYPPYWKRVVWPQAQDLST